MIRNLSGSGRHEIETDVLVIGAGTVGLVMATHLSKLGINVVALESGGLQQDEEEHPLNEVIHLKEKYAGAAHGRFRCIGGTSTRWGGALIPFLPADLDGRDWPINHAEILEFLPEVEKLFHLNQGGYEVSDQASLVGSGLCENHVARIAKWPSFSNRNVSNLLHSEISDDNAKLTIWYNATATQFKVGDNLGLNAVLAQSPDGSKIHVTAKEIVFTAGAIETTRLLLLMRRQNMSRLSHIKNTLGHYFYDHLSVKVGSLEVSNKKKLNQIVGFQFEKNGVMRNIRFELANGSMLRKEIPPCFAHIAFEESEKGGFDALREFFRCIQRRKIPTLEILVRLASSTPWLLQAVWWRLVNRRLLFPRKAIFQVHMVIEQVPRFESCITLSETRKDIFGQPLAEISWGIDQKDVANLTRATDEFQIAWNKSRLSSFANFVRRPTGVAEAELMNGGGIYHPGGSTRMAKEAASGVVDGDLKLFGLENVSVVSTSVLPTGGGANPTMMEMMLALRSVKSISKKFGKARV